MHSIEICIAGAGIIGLSLALELHHRGARVTVLDQGHPLAEASTAAAGMLAAADPDNPPELRPLSLLSLSLYPGFLDRIESLSGIRVPFHTSTTLQALPSHLAGKVREQDTLAPETLALMLPQLNSGNHRFVLLAEESLDPRELAAALLAAVQATPIELRPHTAIRSIRSVRSGVEIDTSVGVVTAANFVDCTGAWSLTSHLLPHLRVTPLKGQMLAVALPPDFPLHVVVRTPEIYVVPRTTGPSANRAVIGATVEDAGFDKTVHAGDIARLRSLAAALLPQLADAREVETWSGLRPTTADRLPILGALRGESNLSGPDKSNLYIATGHYRNGILLAPATAHLMAQVLAGETSSIDLSRFSPDRLPTQRD
ncbi:MAG TPA: FAD-dependent oxidoreductase [Edaphobacter sp.]